MNNPFTWDYLTTAPAAADVFDLFGVVFLLVFAIGFLVALYLANAGASRVAGHPVARRTVRRLAGIATFVFGAGLFFFGVRALGIDPFTFGRPIWLWLCVIAAITLVAYCFYYLRTVYPEQLRAHERQQIKQRYLRPAATASTALRPVTAPPPRPSRRRPR